ncbi:MAG: TonB-dependent receptor [Gammaproteobacteria bacterium]|nr:MAG: TonB-dependent receptor [Gammaproteobacteria bacterium]
MKAVQSRPLTSLTLAIQLAISTALFAVFSPLSWAADTTSQIAARHYSISQGSLDQVLSDFAIKADIDLAINASLTAGKQSRGVQGDYSLNGALNHILTGSGLTAQQLENGRYVIKAIQTFDTINIPTLTIEDSGLSGYQRDEQGYDDVYDKNTSTVYMGKIEIERYKGTTPSDLLQGMAGIFSGEARNSGALDVNIRGIQGPGRVPVIIDGTEQALTVWRGYNGATNRNYIDPNLIGSIQIHKGATNERDVNSGIGGAMVVTTLQPADIIEEGEDFGIELKVEGSSNAVDERVPDLHTGELAVDVVGYPSNLGTPFNDLTLRVTPESKSGKDLNPLNGNDYSYRLAAAKKWDKFDFLAAYAYRERGNYFSGNNNSDYYSSSVADAKEYRDRIRALASLWQPGDEVLNTSSKMESWLLKSSWRITEDQKLSLNYRRSDSTYGEIMPSRIVSSDAAGEVQWPLSEVTSKAYNIDYSYKPVENQWLDVQSTLWYTDTESDTYTSGGFPNQQRLDTNQNPLDGTLVDGAAVNSTSTRAGLTLSNKMNLSRKLDLTIGGHFQREKLSSDDDFEFTKTIPYHSYPRAGRRQEWDGNFDLAWQTTNRLKINGGMKYSSYWAKDDFLADHPEFKQFNVTHYEVEYDTSHTWTDAERVTELNALGVTPAALQGLVGLFYTQEQVDTLYTDPNNSIALSFIGTGVETKQNAAGNWYSDADGNYDRATNPCTNGGLDNVAYLSACRALAVKSSEAQKAQKQKDHGWVPHLTAAYEISQHSRVYFKYAEAIRYPSMFESTIGFSANTRSFSLKPEHAYNWELGYVHDLTQWLPNAEYADIKLTYYQNLTKDVIERDENLTFNNVDEQRIKGIELDFRYDSGRYFTQLGVNYTLQNQICDEDSAAQLSAIDLFRANNDPIPTCFDYGFPGGYQLAQATPKLSANWSLGGRFLKRRLELGSRFTYYKEYENDDLDWYIDNVGTPGNPGFRYSFNTAYSWDEVIIVDAYARYNVNDDLIVELSGSNLSDQYYVDPATRSALAAPGRTLKLSLTARF